MLSKREQKVLNLFFFAYLHIDIEKLKTLNQNQEVFIKGYISVTITTAYLDMRTA